MDSSSYPDLNCGSQYRVHVRWYLFVNSHCHNGGHVTSQTGNYSFQELEIMSTHFLIAWLYSRLILLLLLLIHALFLPNNFPAAAPPPPLPPPHPPAVLLHLASKLIPETVV